jgi:superfamily I DNA/RNA helicase
MRWLPTLRDLSEEQQHIINQDLNKNTLVYGPAGAGKSVITLYRAKTLHDLNKKFVIFVYTKELYNFLQAAINDLDIPQQCLYSFYSWVWGQYKRNIGDPPTDIADKYSVWVDHLIDYFQSQPQKTPRYDYILVDEGQDFKQNVSRLLHMLSSNIFVSGDIAQSLYTDVGHIRQLQERWTPIQKQGHLTRNYRNTRAVAQVAATFVTGMSPEDFLRDVVGRSYDEKPIWYEVASFDEQIDRIVQIVKDARGQHRIGILLRRNETIKTFQEQLEQQGVDIFVPQKRRGHHVYNTHQPILMTVHSAKGLEFDWVILPELVREEWDGGHQNRETRRLFFVAITRTKNRLYLLSEKGQTCTYLSQIPQDLLQRPFSQVSAQLDFDEDDLPF